MSVFPVIDVEWALENGFKDGDHRNYIMRNDLLIIEDEETEFKHTMFELETNDFFEKKGVGVHVWEKQFQSGWMHIGDEKVKIKSLKVEYRKAPPMHAQININFEQYVLAVMEYINGRQGKYLVLKTGERQRF